MAVADVTVDATTVAGTDADLQAAVIVTDTAATVVQAEAEAAVTEEAEEETKLFFSLSSPPVDGKACLAPTLSIIFSAIHL